MRTLIFLACLTLAQPALASPLFGDVDDAEDFFGMQLPDDRRAERSGRLSTRVPASARTGWSRFRADQGRRWTAIWDEHTRVPNRIFGSYVDAPGASVDPRTAERATRDLLFGHLDLLAPGAQTSDFVLVSNHLTSDGSLRSLGFEQYHQGLKVLGGQINARIKNDRIFVLGSDAYPNVSVEMPQGRASDGLLIFQAESWITAERQTRVRTATPPQGPMILPIRENGAVHYEVVMKVHVAALDKVEEWDVYLRPEDGSFVAREQTLMFADGEVRVQTPDRWPGNGRVSEPLTGIRLQVDGLSASPFEVFTEGSGTVTWPGEGAATLTTPTVNLSIPVSSGFGGPSSSGLAGVNVEVSNEGGPTSISRSIDPDGIATFDSTNQFVEATFNLYVANQVARERALVIEPNQAWLDRPFQSVANNDSTQFACNAFSNRTQTYFFRRVNFQGGFCENTGLVDDIVYHEFGHSLHGQNVIPGVGQFTSDHSEGLSDYYSATITNDSAVGRGITGSSSSAIRDIDPFGREDSWVTLQNSSSQHERGLTFGGTMWDIRTALIRKYGEAQGVARTDAMFFATVQRASAITNTFIEALTENDDDGDLGNGTPDFCEIVASFSAHGLAIGTPFTLNLGEISRDGDQISMPVQKPNVTCPDPLPGQQLDQVVLSWRDASTGATGQIELVEVPGEDRYAAEFPFQVVDPGSLITYAVTVTRGDGSIEQRPDAAFDPNYKLLVGDFDEVFCTDFERDPFANDGFTSALITGDPNSAGADDWQWGETAGLNGDPAEAFSPSNVVGNDLGGQRGENNFNGQYQRGISNQLRLPAFDVDGYDKVFIRFRRWLNVFDRQFDQADVFSNGRSVWQNVRGAQGDFFGHFDQEWREEILEVTNTVSAQGDVAITFGLTTVDGRFPGSGGWTLDDFCVLGFNEAVCGDGQITQRELCDDGNTEDGDGCEATCIPTPLVCGNGLVQEGEDCDDGNTEDNDGCQADCTETPRVCGNGFLQEGEACDDGNNTDGDGCQADCTSTPVCGNGVQEAGERCDDGNTADGDGCQADCTPTPAPICGDGNMDPGEACDDGNTTDGDGCQADCTLTPADVGNGGDGGGTLSPSGGGCAATETGSTPTVFVLLLAGLFFARRRSR